MDIQKVWHLQVQCSPYIMLCLVSIRMNSVIWASSRQNLSSGFRQSETHTSLFGYTDQLEKLNFDIVLYKTQITKALIRLCGCAGWSAPVLFANPRRQVFSHRGPYKGAILRWNYRKMTMKWSFSYNSFVKFHGKKKYGNHNTAMLYPNLSYINVCYKGTAQHSIMVIFNGKEIFEQL